MKKVWIYIAGLAVILAVLGVYFTGNRTSSQSPGFAPGSSVFTGRIVSGSLAPGVYSGGAVLTDNGCTTDPKTGLSNCTAQIQIDSSVIAFNYEHNMTVKPCLSFGDKVNVEIYPDGTAAVNRTYWAGGGI